MRKAILAALLLVICTDLADAAKRGKRPAPPPPPEFVPPPVEAMPLNWSGFYIGGNAGGGWAQTRSDFSVGGAPAFAAASNVLSGVLGGGQLGFNVQNGAGVFGVEADFQFAGLKGTVDAPPCPAAVCGVATSASYSQKMPWFGTVRGRFGFAQGTWLAYVTGGYAYARLNTEAVATAGPLTASATRSEVRSGWTVGAGTELALDRQWSVKMEYLYLDFASKDGTWDIAGLAINDRSRIYGNVVRAGLNYRF
jgi:outer membrane immunogenic protein